MRLAAGNCAGRGATVRARGAKVDAQQPRPATGIVLVVDDEPDHCTTLRGILRREVEQVVTCGDVLSARALAETVRFDVVVADLCVGDDDGLALMRDLRAAQPELPVVILTAYPSRESCRSALLAGAAAYVEKPYSPEALRALVAALISGGEPSF